jgi:hypothetical protein
VNAKSVTIVALLAVLVALSFSWKPWQASQKLKREIAVMRAELRARDISLREQAALLDRLREEQNALKQESVALQQEKSARRDGSTSVRDEVNSQSANAKNSKEELIRRSLEDPRMKESFRQYEIGRLQLVYGDFFRDRQLTPEQSTQFVDLAFAQGERDMEDGSRFLSGDQDAGESPLTKAEMDREMRALLGDDAFEKYEAYDKTTTERLAVAEVREALSRTSAPLEEDRADTLLQIMLEERERTPLTAFDPRVPGTSRDKFLAVAQGDNAEQFYRAQTELNQRILGRAGTILSSDQYEALESRLNQYLEVQKISIEMARATTRKKGR